MVWAWKNAGRYHEQKAHPRRNRPSRSRHSDEQSLQNPDSVLQQRGRDMRLYDELLRDDLVKPCFQQRRLAVTQSEWDVEPASESSEDKAEAAFIKEQLQNHRFDGIADKIIQCFTGMQ